MFAGPPAGSVGLEEPGENDATIQDQAEDDGLPVVYFTDAEDE